MERPCELDTLEREAGFDAQALGGGPGGLDPHADVADPGAGRPAQGGDVRGRDGFRPDLTPDSGRAAVPDDVRLRLPVLLAARLLQAARVIVRSHDDGLEVVVVQGVRDVGMEAHVPSLMGGDMNAVDPHVGPVVDGLEMEEDPPVTGGGQHRATPVPDGRVPVLLDARQPRFGREGHGDRAVERGVRAPPALEQAAIVVVEAEFPLAVQIGPLLPRRQRPRVQARPAHARDPSTGTKMRMTDGPRLAQSA